MAPTPFSESTFQENLLTSLIPIQNKTNTTSDSHLFRNSVNSSTRTEVQSILRNSILQAKKDFEDYTESQRNLLSNNFKNQLNILDISHKKSLDESIFKTPSNDFHIMKKGPFFQDPFFEECRRQFEKSVQDIVTKFDLSSSVANESTSNLLDSDVHSNFLNDAFKSYRNLRDTHLQEENQAASLVHADHQHKIVIDVKDFMGGDIKVNSFSNTIRIEVQQENSSQSPQKSSSDKRNFTKEFTLPGSVNMDSVKSTMSSDGILTIIVPRSQPELTARISSPREPDMSQPSQMTQPPSLMTQAPSQSERHLTIQELPSDEETDAVTKSQPELTARISFPIETDLIQPSQMTHSPSQMKQLPLQMTQITSETTKSPSQMTQSPSEITHLPSQLIQSPSHVTQSPSQMTQLTSETAQLPTQTAQSSSQITQSPSQMTHLLEMSHSPFQMTQSPSQMTQPPSQVTRLPSQRISPSQMTHLLEMSHSPKY